MDGPWAGGACDGGCWYCGGGCWYCCWYCGGGCPYWPCCCCASRSAMRWFCSSSAYAASCDFRAMCRPAAYAPPPTTAARINGRRLIMTGLLRRCAGPGRAYSPSSSPSTPAGRERPRAIISSGAAATTRGPPTCGATAFNTPRRSSGVQPDPSALATCQRYEDGGASSAIRAAILTSEYVRPSKPLVSCQSARASRPASNSSGSLRASPARVSLVATSTSTLLGIVMGQILSVGSQGGPMPGPPGGYLLPLGEGFGVTRQGGCGGGRCGRFRPAGEEPEPGGPRIPLVDHRGARDEVVQGAPFPLHEDAEKPQAEQQEAEREHQRADHAAPRLRDRAVGPHHPNAEHGHAERPAAYRPGIAEVEELPGHVEDHDDDVLPVPGDLVAGNELRHVGDGREREGEHPGTGEQVDGVGHEAGHRPRVVALRAHRPGGHRRAHCVASFAGASLGRAGGTPDCGAGGSGVRGASPGASGVSPPGPRNGAVGGAGVSLAASPSSGARGATGAGCLRRRARCTQRSMN